MKKSILAATALAVMLPGLLQARTWSSSDGSKTFEGELRSYDAESGQVTVIMSNGRQVTFAKDKLSEADAEYLLEMANAEPEVDPEEKLASQKVGKQVLKAKLQRLEGSRYKRAELEKAPDYYILYYSASW